jgi:hypothetical protein
MRRAGPIALTWTALFCVSAQAAAQAPQDGGWREPADPGGADPELAEAAAPASRELDVGAERSGTIDVSAEAPPAAVPRSHHVHDGFYLRAAMGIGALGARFDDDSALDASAKTSRGSFALDLMIGGSPSPGVALGGALLLEGIYGATFEHDGREVGDGSVMLGLIGGFIDGHPDPRRGFHLGGALGLTSLRADELGPNGDRLDMAGIGGAFWLGYDFWVGSEWSLGPLLRVMASVNRDREDELDTTAVTRSISLSFTALYH